MPRRSWCPLCVQGKGRADNHPKQHSKTPVIQVGITYYKSIRETKTTPVLTAVDVETGMCMAVQIEDTTHRMQYLSTCLQQFLMECGRTQATLNNTVIQSDQEDFLKAALKMTATAVGNIAVRQSPAYTSQAQGSVNRFHRTLMGQIRTLKLQTTTAYISAPHIQSCIGWWNVQHTYSTGTQCIRMATPATTDAGTRNTKQQSVSLVKQFSTWCQQQNTGLRWKHASFQAIWLGKDTSTNENVLSISGHIVKARTIRRQTKPDKYNKQMMDIIDSTPMTTPTPTSFVVLPTKHTDSSRQAAAQQRHRQSKHRNFQFRKQANTWLPRQSPTFRWQHRQRHTRRAPLPAPTTTKRDVADDIAEGSSAKQQKTTQQQTAAQRPEATQEPDKTRLRVSAVTVTTKRGDKVPGSLQRRPTRSRNREDPSRTVGHQHRRFGQEQTTEGMKQEIRSMKAQQVYTEVSYNTLTSEQRNKIIKSRWSFRQKGDIVRARIVAKEYTEEVKDNVYASTPIFCVLRLLLTMSLVNKWKVKAGDISTAFLHAKAATDDLFMFPPT